MKFINNEDFYGNLGEVTNPKIIASGTYTKDGLFSQDIFGSSVARCHCGKMEGNFYINQTCSNCNTKAKLQDDEGAKISIEVDDFNIRFFNPIVLSMIQKELKINIMNLINPQNKKVDLNGNIIIDDDNYSFKDFYNNYHETIEKLLHSNNIDLDLEFVQWLLENEDIVLTKNIYVIPTRYREVQVTSAETVTIDSINSYYLSILTHANNIKELTDTIITSSNIEVELYELQMSYNELIDFIIKDVIGGKEGLVRGNILSSRIGFSGRAPITLRETHEDMTCVTLPVDMFIEMYYLRIIKYLMDNFNHTIVSAEHHILMNRFNYNDDLIITAIKYIIDEEKPLVVINRNPTLRIENMVALEVDSVHEYSTIRVPKQVLPCQAADIDGDTVAVFSVTTDEARQELELLKINNNLMCKYTGGISNYLLPYQDNTLGIELIKDRLNGTT